MNIYDMPMAPTQVVNGKNGLPINPGLVLGENGTAFVSYGANVVSFNLNTSAANWNYQAPAQTTLSIIASAAGNSLVGKTTDQTTGMDTVLHFDSTGAVTPDTSTASGASYSWSGNWYINSPNGVSALALPFIDDMGSTSYWGFLNGNPSHNGAATLQCCTPPSLAWVFGIPSQDSTKPSTPDVQKTFPLNNISCSKNPSQIMSDMESNFASFANFTGNSNFLGFPVISATVTFSGTVALGNTISIHNVNVDRITGGSVKTNTFDVAVQITQVNPNDFTFTTLPGHVLFPATISFAASSSGAGSLNFAINVNGKFANKSAERGYRVAGSNLEDHIWKHVLAQVQSDCK